MQIKSIERINSLFLCRNFKTTIYRQTVTNNYLLRCVITGSTGIWPGPIHSQTNKSPFLRQKNAFNPIIIMSFYYCEMLSHSYEICLQRLTELRFSSNQMNSISATCLFMTKTYWRTAKSFWHKGSMWIGWLPKQKATKHNEVLIYGRLHLKIIITCYI